MPLPEFRLGKSDQLSPYPLKLQTLFAASFPLGRPGHGVGNAVLVGFRLRAKGHKDISFLLLAQAVKLHHVIDHLLGICDLDFGRLPLIPLIKCQKRQK